MWPRVEMIKEERWNGEKQIAFGFARPTRPHNWIHKSFQQLVQHFYRRVWFSFFHAPLMKQWESKIPNPKWCILVLSSFTAFAAINVTDFSINDLKNNLPDGVALPPELEGFSLPTENITKFLKEKCVKETGSDAAYEAASVRQFKFNLIWPKLVMQISVLFCRL